MNLRRSIRLILTFYKSFFLLNFLITIACLVLHWEYGYAIFSKLLGLKLVVLGLSFYFNSQYRRNEFYYYRNAGLSKKILWTSTAAIDLLLFLLLITKMPLRT